MDPCVLYNELLSTFGPQGWWPKHSVLRTATFDPCFEVLVGCILTQNTAWNNVEKAVHQLFRASLLSPRALLQAREEDLHTCIRPSGYFRTKAKYLRALAEYIVTHYCGNTEDCMRAVDRDHLLTLPGIGPETADSMLLYGGNRPYFVIDTYTKRLLASRGVVLSGYHAYQTFFTRALPEDVTLFQEFHALIVQWGKHARGYGTSS